MSSVSLRKCSLDHCNELCVSLVKGIRLCKFHQQDLLSETQENTRFDEHLKETAAKLDKTKVKSK